MGKLAMSPGRCQCHQECDIPGSCAAVPAALPSLARGCVGAVSPRVPALLEGDSQGNALEVPGGTGDHGGQRWGSVSVSLPRDL